MHVTKIHMVFTTKGSFDVAIGSWPKQHLNPQTPNSAQMFSLSEL